MIRIGAFGHGHGRAQQQDGNRGWRLLDVVGGRHDGDNDEREQQRQWQ